MAQTVYATVKWIDPVQPAMFLHAPSQGQMFWPCYPMNLSDNTSGPNAVFNVSAPDGACPVDLEFELLVTVKRGLKTIATGVVVAPPPPPPPEP